MSDNGKTYLYQNIWQQFLEGDNEALSSIYFDFFDILFNFGMKYSSDCCIVEDCIQNLFVDLLKNRAKLKLVQNIKFYLMKALRYQIILEYRKTKNLFPIEETSKIDFMIAYSVENSLISEETDEMRDEFLKKVLKDLTVRQQEALYLKFNCGFDYVQIAELMQISVESVRTIIYRTLKSIRETMGSYNYSNLILFRIFRCL